MAGIFTNSWEMARSCWPSRIPAGVGMYDKNRIDEDGKNDKRILEEAVHSK